jgi:ABC-type uncharacterized transport system substrate-binding protein
VIVAIGAEEPARAAMASTASIPIVFASGADSLVSGLVGGLNRPNANITGVSFGNNELGPKRVGLLRDLLPDATSIAYLTSTSLDQSQTNAEHRALLAAARGIGRDVAIFDAVTEQEIESAFAGMIKRKVPALLVSPNAILNTRRQHIIALAALYAIPTIYPNREYVRAGGLMSYGVELYDLYRQAGIYAGRIIKGAKPADLPVVQPTKFEFVINLKTAKALGLTIPPGVLAIADEVIE